MVLEQMITSFIASATFGVLFNVPRNSIIKSGLVGMIGWILYYEMVEMGNYAIFSTLVAAFVVGIISQFFAKKYKTPIIIFSVSGIIPLVPGGLAYDAMKHFVQSDYNVAIELSIKGFMLAGAIAMGMILADVIKQLTVKYGKRNQRLAKIK